MEYTDIMFSLLSIAIIPILSYIILIAFWLFSINRKSTYGLIVDSVLIGLAAVGITGIVKNVVFLVLNYVYIINVSILTPIIEEGTKSLLVVALLHQRRMTARQCLLCSSIVGASFAAVENIIYGYSYYYQYGFDFALYIVAIRTTFFPIGHMLFTMLFGYFLAAKRHPILGLLLAISLHSLWNVGIVLLGGYFISYIFLYYITYYGILFAIIYHVFRPKERLIKFLSTSS